MSNLAPGKGFHGVLTGDTIDFFWEVIQEVYENYGTDGNALKEAGKHKEIMDRLYGSATGWKKAKDNFGDKLYKEMDWQGGSYRVTVILQKGELKLDIRHWYSND